VILNELLDQNYTSRINTIRSAADPPPVKFMLRCKNKLMCAGRLEQAAVLFNSAELFRVDVIADPRSTWGKVRQLTGLCSKAGDVAQNPIVIAEIFNNN